MSDQPVLIPTTATLPLKPGRIRATKPQAAPDFGLFNVNTTTDLFKGK